MNTKILKIIFLNWKSYLVFVFFATFLSLFSYILWNNIVFWVQDYLKSQIKPILSWDLTISSNDEIINENDILKYQDKFEIAKTISLNSTIFDLEKNSSLVEVNYHTNNFPFYDSFAFDTINNSWSLIVDKKIYERFGNEIEVLWKKYLVKWIIKSSFLTDVSIYSNSSRIYLPIEDFNKELNSNNSRINYKYYLKFRWGYDVSMFEIIKNDETLDSYRIRTVEDRDESIWNITDRFYLFINFFNLVIFVLTFFIIILALETFFKKIKWTIWLLNIFWVKKSKIFFYSLFSLWIVFTLAFLTSYILNIFAINLLNSYYDIFKFYDSSVIKWLLITIFLLIIWIFSPFYKIFKSKIWDLLNDKSNFSNFSVLDYFVYLFLIFFWFIWVNIISWIWVFYWTLYSLLFLTFVFIFYILIEKSLNFNFKFLSKIISFKSNFYFFDAIRSTIKPWNVSFLVVFSWIVSFLSIFIFFVFSWSFLNYLNKLTNDSNDTFIINVQQNDIDKINKYFNEEEKYEIVTLRIESINSKSLQEFLNVKNVPRQFSREFFSTTKNLPNKVLKWDKLTSSWVSVDIEFAKELWLNIWDEITFSVAWLEKTLRVQNFREALRDWTSPFFYFMLYKDDFVKFPKNYIISYKSKDKEKNLEFTLYKEVWPHISFIDTKDIIAIVIDVSEKILIVVYTCLFYVFIFSFLSFIVSISFLKSFKIYKLKILNILWWEKRLLIRYLNIEYVYLVLVSFFISIIFWSIFLYFIFYFVKIISFSYLSYFYWILILLSLIFVLYIYLYFSNRKIIK